MLNSITISNKQKTINWAWLITLFLAPIILWILPSTFFDGDGIIVCPTRLFFNFECLGCGMTRAVMHFHHFEFDDAVYYNRGSLLIYPALVVVWAIWVIRAFKKTGLLDK